MQFQRAFGQAFGTETTIAEVVFGLVIAAMVVAFAGSRRRRRRGKASSERAENNPLELTYVAVLAVVVGFVVYISFSTNARYWRDPPPDMTVKVTAFQWCWDFQYPRTPVNVLAQCHGGGTPTLVLPAGRSVRVELTSRDVIHSFWVPGLRLKLDIYPQHVNSFTVTLHDGRWVGHCAEFCGLYHAEMMFHLRAIPPAQFDRWLHARGGPVQEVGTR
jgi:cytochrome c oxidase subunit 2